MVFLCFLLISACDIQRVKISWGRGYAVPVVVRWLCGGLHQIITFSFARNTGFFCFLLSLRPAPLRVTAYITQFGSCSSYIIQNSEAKQLSCVCFVKQSSSRLPSLKCHNTAHPGKYFSDRFLLLEDLRWNTLVWQQMKRGVYVLYIYKLSGSRWKRWRSRWGIFNLVILKLQK